jgi:hypothetical protein
MFVPMYRASISAYLGALGTHNCEADYAPIGREAPLPGKTLVNWCAF